MTSKAQIDRLGDRLRDSVAADDDLRLLDEYRRSFSGSFEAVFTALKRDIGLEPAGRPSKTTDAIIAKLRRGSIRLSRMQDVAGCRVVVRDIASQDDVVRRVLDALIRPVVIDRRVNPNHGYRAVHIIETGRTMPVEIQVRTDSQHRWAQLSERLADVFGPGVKYGAGEPAVRILLDTSSELVARFEANEGADSGGIAAPARVGVEGTASAYVYGALREQFEISMHELALELEAIARAKHAIPD